MNDSIEVGLIVVGELEPAQARFLLILSGRAIEAADTSDEPNLEIKGNLDCIGASMLLIAKSDQAQSLFDAYVEYNESKGNEVILGRDILNEMAELGKNEWRKQILCSVTTKEVEDYLAFGGAGL